jgi:hypothetical protein
MKEIRFLQVLHELKMSEKNRLVKFLMSPYCTPNQKLIEFYQALPLHSLDDFMLSEIEKKSIWSALYPSKKYSDVSWRKLCHDLIEAIYLFFKFQALQSDVLQGELALLSYFNEHKLEATRQAVVHGSSRLFSQHKSPASHFHLKSMQRERLIYDIEEYEQQIESPSNLQALHESLDLFYISEKIKQIVAVQSRRGFINIPISIRFEAELINWIEGQDLQNLPEIGTYYLIYRLKLGAESYDLVKPRLIQNLEILTAEDSIGVVKEIINYCVAMLNQGQSQFSQETLEWYQYGLRKRVIFPEDRFNRGDFMNIVMAGIRTKSFDWTQRFIEDYQLIIPKETKKDIVTFSYARLFFNQKKLDQVIEKLRDVEFQELTYNLDARVLLLATYYEADELQAMHSLADAFRTFLSRHEKDILPATKSRYSNFIKFIKKLSRTRFQDKSAKIKLIEEIQASPGVINPAWLLEKARLL